MTDIKRRKFLSTAGKTAVALPVVALVPMNQLLAQDMPAVDANSAQAQALKYAAVSEMEGQNCKGCALYQGGDAATGACPLFQGSHVAAEAWCSAFAPRS